MNFFFFAASLSNTNENKTCKAYTVHVCKCYNDIDIHIYKYITLKLIHGRRKVAHKKTVVQSTKRKHISTSTKHRYTNEKKRKKNKKQQTIKIRNTEKCKYKITFGIG